MSATYSPLRYDGEHGTVRPNKVYKSQVTLIRTLVLLLPVALGFCCLSLNLTVCGAGWITTALANGECVVYVHGSFSNTMHSISLRSNHLPASLWAWEMTWQM